MAEKILILGGARFHGLQIALSLCNKGKNVYVLNRGNYNSNYDPKIHHLITDRNNQKSLENVFKNHTFDVVIDNNAYNPYQVKTVMELIRNKCKHYIFTSTFAVYFKVSSNHKLLEKEATGIPGESYYPWISKYAMDKFAAERMLVQEYNGLNYTILRLPTVFGEGDFLGKLAYLYYRLKDGGPITLEKEVKSFNIVYVQDLVNIYNAVIENEVCFGRILNIADPKMYDYDEFFYSIYGDLYTPNKIVLIQAERMWEAGYWLPFHWGPVLDTSLSEELLNGVVFTPLANWGRKTLKYELEKFKDMNVNSEFIKRRNIESKLIEKLTVKRENKDV